MPRSIVLLLALVVAGWSPLGAAAAEIALQPVVADEVERELGLTRTEALAAVDDPAVVAARAARFPDILHAHVDRFWAREFAREGLVYDQPAAVIGLAEPTMTACGPADPTTEAAFYCLLDETIYYSVAFRRSVETNVGDFGWVVIVAHEWGHHIQQESGIELIAAPDQVGATPPVALEQQADCLAGAYSVSAEEDGWLDPGDIEEAVTVTALSGDPIGTAWNAPGAHGSGEERVAAYLDGYDEGIAGCDFAL